MIIFPFPIMLTIITPEVIGDFSDEIAMPVMKVSGDANIQRVQETLFTSRAEESTIPKRVLVESLDILSDHENATVHPDSGHSFANEVIKTDALKEEEDNFYNETDFLSASVSIQNSLKTRLFSMEDESSGMDDSIFYSNDIFKSAEGSGMTERMKSDIHPPAPPTSAELRFATILPYSSESNESTEGSGIDEDHNNTSTDESVKKDSLRNGTEPIKLLEGYVAPSERTIQSKKKEIISSTRAAFLNKKSPHEHIEMSRDVSVAKRSGNFSDESLGQKRWHPYVFDCQTEEDDRGMLCEEWALAGFCSNNRPTMFLFCRKTCLCTGPKFEFT